VKLQVTLFSLLPEKLPIHSPQGSSSSVQHLTSQLTTLERTDLTTVQSHFVPNISSAKVARVAHPNLADILVLARSSPLRLIVILIISLNLCLSDMLLLTFTRKKN